MKRLVAIIAVTLIPALLFAAAQTNQDKIEQKKIQDYTLSKIHLSDLLNSASAPTKFFFAPSSQILRALEIFFAGGSAFGVEEEGGFLGRAALGLGGVAEVEFSTTQVINQLTGNTTRFPSRAFKIQLVPERFRDYWYVPDIIAQLRTTSWGTVVGDDSRLSPDVRASYEEVNLDQRLEDLSTHSRFTTLYIAAGKQGAFGGITLGVSLTDVRTKEGWQQIFDKNTFLYDQIRLPKMKKEILKPFGGVFINANDKTQIMAEVEAVPEFDYNFEARKVRIRPAWLGIAGVRFFLTNWLSWDTGVRYQSNFAGIADAEINIAANLIVPLKTTVK